MNVQKTFIPPIGVQQRKNVNRNFNRTGTKFADHLQEAYQTNNNLTISKHAQQRLAQRNIEIPNDSWEVISAKVQEARKMGVNESLVLLDNAALLVSAKNQTVITAMDRKEAASQIFTNINGAIIVNQ